MDTKGKKNPQRINSPKNGGKISYKRGKTEIVFDSNNEEVMKFIRSESIRYWAYRILIALVGITSSLLFKFWLDK